MPALTPDTIRAATDTLCRLTEYLRENPDPKEALALVEPLLDEYTGLPIQLGDTLRALARAVQSHPNTPHSEKISDLVTELRAAAWVQTDQYMLHYVLDELRKVVSTAPSEPGCGRCR
ncbi:hypothetical protein [Streptomyces capillispiralis]|uniref:Uncharacterized protein n=1 Tax=Streptomyces capillispiralis TaxID=68182 RepID=A0A561TQ67_9ACTN|nr:hypothetical protein [Streptomyces capillispiralis]TWF89232.1 hypothetical protein FHX78_116274 [Streptomyces capillispiralis]GHH95404.1 hypothetical protein GCM10017779_58610 [Streptomyces capillispiralis]